MVAESLEREVRRRAANRCEYCRVPVEAYIVPFQIDHVIAKQHGGATELSNLAYCCFHCNLHKGPNIGSVDAASNALIPLFNPRRESWTEHFQWDGPQIIGVSAVGRVTVNILAMNHADAVAVRAALIDEGNDFRNDL